MTTLHHDLDAFGSGAIDFAELASTVEKLAQGNPSASSESMLILTEAHDAGMLNAEQYHELLERVVFSDILAVTGVVNDDEEDEKTLVFTAGPASEDVTKVGSGSVIKGRFELMGVLGEGGMGIVYKARDLIKVEAKDRNPYVAIKVLNEDFKAHPEAFIALQRECSKTQKLAHPNIATVYDFDRTGGMVYMTMELLEGEPLNEYIKHKLPEHGFSFKEAWPIIKSLGQALAFAHHRNIVHSDFKPGNAFVSKDGGVKVLDFGIARAVKRPGQSDTTMFDPGTLGALTPAYASCEMLEGDPPDPRDDVYALAVVSYLLLSGKHPFDKYPANMAKALSRTPPPINSITKAQNKALRRALEFSRDDRTPAVQEFLDELEGEDTAEQKLKRQSRLLTIMTIGFVVLAIIVLFLLAK